MSKVITIPATTVGLVYVLSHGLRETLELKTRGHEHWQIKLGQQNTDCLTTEYFGRGSAELTFPRGKVRLRAHILLEDMTLRINKQSWWTVYLWVQAHDGWEVLRAGYGYWPHNNTFFWNERMVVPDLPPKETEF
jgi:hypothetical protein